ncbi:FixH family protein [Virgibacillus sp. JSM 102003]|uniref:FixH family protein n=1 Tax=Virgibacillus sp. JSM 102003 TaxID=1562108 RepID=UPI0035BF6B69
MKKMMIFLFIIIVLTACGQSEETDKGTTGDVVKAINAKLEVPKKADKEQDVTFSVTVTQDNKPVEDASEVEFEIWKEGLKDKSEMIAAEHSGDGKYTVQKSFDEAGVYHVQSHVTARTMHTMPKEKISIGDVKATTKTDKNKKESDESHSHLSINLKQPEKVTVGKEANFSVKVLQKEEILEKASVTLEIWQKNNEKHEWIDMSETSSGTYETTTTFKNSGTYTINVHVKKEEIHGHKEFTAEVQ